MKTWQESVLADLPSALKADGNVVGMLLFGSLAASEPHMDEWSDIDILLVVKEEALDAYFPSVEWIRAFGPLYTYSQSTDDFTYTTRACFANFQRIDFVISSEGKLAEIQRWPAIPFTAGVRVLFSRFGGIEEIAQRQYPQREMSPVPQAQFLALIRDFRFKSILATHKVVRGDLLIALHLAQDLVRDCCVLGMMLRDRATGTNIHKDGGIGNEYVAQLQATQKP